MRSNKRGRGRHHPVENRGIWAKGLLIWLQQKVEQALAPCPGQEEEQDEAD